MQFLAMNDNIKKCENLKYLDFAFLAALMHFWRLSDL